MCNKKAELQNSATNKNKEEVGRIMNLPNDEVERIADHVCQIVTRQLEATARRKHTEPHPRAMASNSLGEVGQMPIVRACKQCGKKNRVPAKHLADTGRCGACKSPLPPVDEPLSVSREEFDEIVQTARVPVLVDFWADWCGPCHMASPEVTKTAADMAGRAVVVKIDTEQYPDLAGRYNVRGIPNVVVLYEGRPVMQQAGVVDHNQMENWLKSAVPATAV